MRTRVFEMMGRTVVDLETDSGRSGTWGFAEAVTEEEVAADPEGWMDRIEAERGESMARAEATRQASGVTVADLMDAIAELGDMVASIKEV